MKKFILPIVFSLLVNTSFAQEENIYNPSANAKADLSKIVAKAKTENKFVLIQAGGNWCIWCIEFSKFSKANFQIDSIIKANFVLYHLNYSPENKNKEIFAKLGFPQRFGFPSFIILNGKGERIHTQSSEYLGDGKSSYDEIRVKEFLINWSPAALNAKSYK